MGETVTSRLSGFHKLGVAERLGTVSKMYRLTPEETHAFAGAASLTTDLANTMIENAIGVFGLPLGLGLNMQVNGRDYVVPMAVEEPSVIAAVSFAAKIARENGGFTAEADDPITVVPPSAIGEKLVMLRELSEVLCSITTRLNGGAPALTVSTKAKS